MIAERMPTMSFAVVVALGNAVGAALNAAPTRPGRK